MMIVFRESAIAAGFRKQTSRKASFNDAGVKVSWQMVGAAMPECWLVSPLLSDIAWPCAVLRDARHIAAKTNNGATDFQY
jgi:hypothetical protein